MSEPYIYEGSTEASMVIVPDALHAAINAKLDAAIAEVPDAARERDSLYNMLVGFFNDHGYLPDFSLAKKPEVQA